MATNSGDLARALIEGGLAPQASRIIANAIANAASPTLSKGGDTTDATPTEALRLITPDTRRYRLTNLDYSPSDPFQQRLTTTAGKFAPPDRDHPYKDSQPVSTAPPLSSPRVQGGNYVAVENIVEGSAAISRLDLKLKTEQGRHLRLDPSTKSLEAIAWSATSDSPRVLGAEVREGEQGTELVISLRNLQEVTTLLGNGDTRKVLAFVQEDAVGPENGTANVSRSLATKSIRLANGNSQNALLWTSGSETAGPAAPAATCRAFVVFNGTGTGSPITPIASANVSTVTRSSTTSPGFSVFEITMTTALDNANYAVIGTSSAGGSGEQRTVILRSDLTPTTTKFSIQILEGATPTNAGIARVSVAVFA